MRLPSRKQLAEMPWHNAAEILDAHERDERDLLNTESLWHRRGKAYARKLTREKLKRIELMKKELGL